MLCGLFLQRDNAMMNIHGPETTDCRMGKEREILKNTIEKLRENSRHMTNTDREIVKYILLNAEKVAYMNIRELSQETFSSTSTIYRMCRNLGFQGYKDFRQSLIYDVARRDIAEKPETVENRQDSGLEKIVEAVTNQNIVSLKDTASLIDIQSLRRCVSLLGKARMILLFGMGESLCVARDAYLKFLKCHKPCILNEDPRTQLLAAGNSDPEDLGIVICGSAETELLLECIRHLQKNGTPVIAITRPGAVQIPMLANCTIYSAADNLPLTDGAANRISQMNVIDILCTAHVRGTGAGDSIQ